MIFYNYLLEMEKMKEIRDKRDAEKPMEKSYTYIS